MITLNALGMTDQGSVRKVNHDAFLIDNDLKLFIVCDGVSSNSQAHQASTLCIETIKNNLGSQKNIITQTTLSTQDRKNITHLINDSIQEASQKIFDLAQNDPSLTGLSTTLDLIWIIGSYAFIAHVGDGRVYLYREQKIHTMTTDHNYSTDLVLYENKTPEEAKKYAFADALTRAVGIQARVKPDILEIELLSSDVLFLCSDGVYRYFETPELSAILKNPELPKIIPGFIEEGKRRGGHDNLTALGITIKREESSEQKNVLDQIKTIQKMSLFQFMSYQELLKILSAAELKHYKAGDTIIKEGEMGEDMFVVVSGYVSVQKGGNEITILSQGHTIGEMSLIESGERSATAIAKDKVCLMYFARKELFILFRSELQVSVKFFWMLAKDLTGRLRKTTNQLSEAKMDIQILKKGEE